ncbi:olfactory receptor 2K2-like [Pygocentrus nattereri]|uniref:olfactory receptor 2K2-like n=1 Tax=Pygocentrus nattereri TaxID=42514 RepID=UPI0008146D54|nr:olfactory receptor 2K2-like [Pygocentrus nattereri]
MDNISGVILTFTALNETDETSKLIIFAFTLPSFFLTVFLNSMLILIIVVEKTLHEPMYIFLGNLCLNDLCGTAGFYPKLLSDLISQTTSVSFQACIVQSYVVFMYGIGEFTNLSVMALDRYLAICRPLYYHSLMCRATVRKLLTFIWMFPCCTVLMIILMAARNPICEQHIDKLYCGSFFLERLICQAHVSEIIIKWIFFCVLVMIVAFVFFSYIKLIIACKQSKVNQNKFMSTCLPHLIVFSNFMALSLLDASHTQFNIDLPQTLQHFNSALILVIPPFVNPIIYGIKLSPIRRHVLYFVKKIAI